MSDYIFISANIAKIELHDKTKLQLDWHPPTNSIFCFGENKPGGYTVRDGNELMLYESKQEFVNTYKNYFILDDEVYRKPYYIIHSSDKSVVKIYRNTYEDILIEVDKIKNLINNEKFIEIKI